MSSPVSIGAAFSLARAGASPDTGGVLDNIFGFPAEDAHSAANAVGLALEASSVEPTTLEVANRLFPDDAFSPLQAFLEVAARSYGATIQPIDSADGERAAEVVNGWVSDTTRGLIPTVVEPIPCRTKTRAGAGEHCVSQGRLGRAVPGRVDR